MRSLVNSILAIVKQYGFVAVFPIIYFLILLWQTLPYRQYGIQPSFNLNTVFVGILFSLIPVIILFVKYEQEKRQTVKQHRALATEVLLTGKLSSLFNSDLFPELHRDGVIEQVESISGGYSGAKIYRIKRAGTDVPDVLKVDYAHEVRNEYSKFSHFVDRKLLIGPQKCQIFIWDDYGALEYNLNQRFRGSYPLTFQQLYKICLQSSSTEQVRIETIEKVIGEELFLFDQLKESWGWKNLGRESINIFDEYYPLTTKFGQIHYWLDDARYGTWNLETSLLTESHWREIVTISSRFLNKYVLWDKRKNDDNYRFNMVRVIIHGDLNARNILLEVTRDDFNDVHAIGLVDFSHTGNGLTQHRTKIIRDDCHISEDSGYLANDFCRLEADIKFRLTDLTNEREMCQAWVLECVLMEQGLEVCDWDDLPENILQALLHKKDFMETDEWASIANRDQFPHKFKLMWRSVKAIRDALLLSLVRVPQRMAPFYMALLQASLTMIYFEDERYHNANLQKRYLLFAAAMLCERLL